MIYFYLEFLIERNKNIFLILEVKVGVFDIILIVVLVVAIIGVGLYFLARWSQNKMSEQQRLISSTTQPHTIYVIDKKRDKAKNANLPKMIME